MWAGANPADIPPAFGSFDADGNWTSDLGYSFSQGRIGQMLSSKVIQWSFMFLGGVLLLLLGLIFLAGRRWHREGMYAHADTIE